MKSRDEGRRSRCAPRLTVGAFLVLFLFMLPFGCGSADSEAVSATALPDKAQFIDQGVSTFMEKRCGSLDCHGQVGRPLRLYSANGLRKNLVKGVRDTRATQPDELLENYYATVGLEPEDISLARVSNGTYTDFLLLKKPLGIEGRGVRHKGGPVLRVTDPGFECLVSWIEGTANKAKCEEAVVQ